jgi:hypothetical protein
MRFVQPRHSFWSSKAFKPKKDRSRAQGRTRSTRSGFAAFTGHGRLQRSHWTRSPLFRCSKACTEFELVLTNSQVPQGLRPPGAMTEAIFVPQGLILCKSKGAYFFCRTISLVSLKRRMESSLMRSSNHDNHPPLQGSPNAILTRHLPRATLPCRRARAIRLGQ